MAARVQALAPQSDVTYRTYAGMAHATCAEEVRDVRAFLQNLASRDAATGEPSEEPAVASEAEFSAMPAARLKAYLRERGVPTDDCYEKAEMVARAVKHAHA